MTTTHPRRRPRWSGRVALVAAACLVAPLAATLSTSSGAPAAAATDPSRPIDEAAVLAAQGIDQPQWYEDNIPFLDTPDAAMDAVYYYRWSTYKRALRDTVPGTGKVSTEYDVPIGYAGNPYTALPDAAGYHIADGRWAADQSFAGDYLDFWLKGAGVPGAKNFSEWIVDAAYQRSLLTGDSADLVDKLPELISIYDGWAGRLTTVPGNDQQKLYWQSPLSDATEYTETSLKSSDAFGGGSGDRPTINAYMYAAAQAISKIAGEAGDQATATTFTERAAALKTGLQDKLWDEQRQFFMQVYRTDDNSNGALKGTRTTWRELMGYAPWAFNVPDAQYSGAWKYLQQPDNFGAEFGPTTLERFHDLEAEQATVTRANAFSSASASNGRYVGQIDFDDSAVSFGVDAPGPGTYPVRVYYANTAASSHQLFVNDSTTPIAVNYPAGPAYGAFSDTRYVTVQVPMQTGRNTLRLAKGTGFAEVDKIAANPYFNWQAIPTDVGNRRDDNCCHWNGPTWPYQTSQVLRGMANLLTDYPAQPYVDAADYREELADFTAFQFKNGKPYVAEAGDADTGKWIYDGENFSENYNHSSYIDLVLSDLIGIKAQADDTVVIDPLVDPTWDHFAVQDVTYHGHKLSIVWDETGTHYGNGAGLRVYQDGALIHTQATLAKATVEIAETVLPPVTQTFSNVAANPLAMEQDWLNRPITQPFPKAFASYTNTVSNGPRCHSGQQCRPTTFDQPLRANNGWIRYDKTPDDRWTNSGSPNATDSLGIDFGAERPIKQLSIYTYDDGADIRVPASYDAQYLDTAGTWRSIPGQSKTPAAPRADDVNVVDFPTISTRQVRVVFTPQPGKYVGVTELQSLYPDSPTARIVNKGSGLELGVTAGATPYGKLVTQESTTGTALHQWDVVPAEDGLYKIVNTKTGFVLGIRNATSNRGEDALLWVDNLSRDHLWRLVDVGDGWTKIVNANSGKVLAVDGGSTTTGAKTVQWDDTGTADQRWRLTTAPTPSAYAVQNRANGLDLAVAGASRDEGAAVVLGSAGSTTEQRWTLTDLPGGAVQVVNQHSGRVLGVTGTSPTVTQTAAADSPATRWQVVSLGDGFHRLVNVASGLALTVDPTAAAGTAVTQQPVSASTGQRWQLLVDNAATEPTGTTPGTTPPAPVPTTPPTVPAPGPTTTTPVTVLPTAGPRSLRARVKGRRAVVGKPVKVVLTSSADGPVTVKAAGRRKTVQVVDGRAVLRVRFTKPGKQKVVVKVPGDRAVVKVTVRR